MYHINMDEMYVAMRMKHIAKTQKVFGLRNAWVDFFIYLDGAIKK
jgi:hypothetical protein